MAPLREKELTEVEARAKAATEGPWDNHVVPDEHAVFALDKPQGKALTVICNYTRPLDARFIAHARTDIPRLVADLRAARVALKSAKEGCLLVFTGAIKYDWTAKEVSRGIKAVVDKIDAALPPEDQ